MSDAGEQGSLRHANQLLSKRFSSRLRPYLSHGPRVMVKHIHQEVEQAFKQDLHIARTRRFRESRHGEGSIAFHWLSTMWQVERWREAVIWSFLVARLGTEGNPDRVLKEVWATAECTRGSSFSNFGTSIGDGADADSMDGHLPTLLLPGQRMTCDGCEASLQGDLFANFAWENVRCGDCCKFIVCKADSDPTSRMCISAGRFICCTAKRITQKATHRRNATATSGRRLYARPHWCRRSPTIRPGSAAAVCLF